MTALPGIVGRAADAALEIVGRGGPQPPTRRRRRALIVAGAIAVGVALLVWVVAFSPLLGVRSVVVRGEQTLTAAEIRSAAHVRHGAALISLDTAGVRRAVESIPRIADATVTVSYPSTVVITVRERVPVGYLELASGAELVDSSGVQFAAATTAPRLPRFEVAPGDAGRASGVAAAAVAGSLPPALLGELSAIVADGPGDVRLDLADGRTVIWGSASNAAANAQKASLLVPVLAKPGHTIDVSDPQVVVVR